jgi:hypothetical protein
MHIVPQFEECESLNPLSAGISGKRRVLSVLCVGDAQYKTRQDNSFTMSNIEQMSSLFLSKMTGLVKPSK